MDRFIVQIILSTNKHLLMRRSDQSFLVTQHCILCSLQSR
ncbi:unnamed protein product [Paramecium octaurelia]|uniref:Uncharacterized protein n=1 Tax=Paramecium octaurelia TaxID=43137 RepID=A0A8S1XR39_PAROT|nr:unnamed protein product [Paramecium octaurelia]